MVTDTLIIFLINTLDKFKFYLYHSICVMMELGITEKDCSQDLGTEFISNINNKFSSKLGSL